MWRRLACQILSRALHISSAPTRVAPDIFKAVKMLSDKTVKSSLIRGLLVTPRKSHFLRWPTSLLFKSSLKIFLTTERRLTGQWFLAVDLSPTFLNTGIKTPNNLRNTVPSDIYWRLQVVFMKVQAHSFAEPLRTTQNTHRIQSGLFDIYISKLQLQSNKHTAKEDYKL